jgi:hypothetical protein
MSHIPFTLLAYFLNNFAVLVDKYLLTGKIQDPLILIFYISLFSLVALVGVPFTHIPTVDTLFLASFSTILWTSGAYFMYKGLQIGHASRVIPVIGTLIPLILFIEALISGSLSQQQLMAVSILIVGLVVLTSPDWKGRMTKKEFSFEIYSAVLFAISYLILKQAYLRTEFLTVLVWSRFILVPVGIALYLIPQTHKIIFNNSDTNQPGFSYFSKTGALFFAGQCAGGVSELLLTYSISLASPALVNSLQGAQYAFLFICNIFLAKKLPHIYHHHHSIFYNGAKIIGILCIAWGLHILAFAE